VCDVVFLPYRAEPRGRELGVRPDSPLRLSETRRLRSPAQQSRAMETRYQPALAGARSWSAVKGASRDTTCPLAPSQWDTYFLFVRPQMVSRRECPADDHP
jgi:hypothetical protein